MADLDAMTMNPYEPPANAEEPAKPDLVRICPQCGQPMEAGYIPSAQGIVWRRLKQWRLWLWLTGNTLPGSTGFLIPTKIGGHRCGHCELVIFRYGSHKLKV